MWGWNPSPRILWLGALAGIFSAVLLGTEGKAEAVLIRVSGSLFYENRLFPETGTGNPNAKSVKPVRFADVQLVRSSNGLLLASGETAADGTFQFQITDPGVLFFIRVLARQQNAFLNILVQDAQSSRLTWSVQSGDILANGQDVVRNNLAILTTNPAQPAFNIFDVLVEGSEKARALSKGTVPPLVTAFWKPGSTDGTYFRSADDTIHLLGTSSDSDGDDDAVILHEYGHFILRHFSVDNNPGGLHRLTDQNQNIRLSWSEGWASFFSGLVRSNSIFVNTLGPSFVSIFDLETPPSVFQQTAKGQDTEVSVFSVLWDIADNPGTDDDPLGLGGQPVWDVVDTAIGATQDAVLEDFYNGWFSLHGAIFFKAEVNEIFTQRSIFYSVPIVFERGPIFLKSEGLGLPIPDNNTTGVASTLDVPQALTAHRLHVFLDLAHSLRKDLVVSLRSPSGTEVLLQNRTPPPDQQSGDNPASLSQSIFGWYQPFETTPAQDLGAFNGISALGIWRLTVKDLSSGNTGSLKRWKLELVQNHAPVFDSAANRIVHEGEPLSFQVKATDPDGDPVSYSATDLPAGASFDPSTRTFSWTPNFEQSGIYQVTLNASDGSLSGSITVTIHVIEVVRVIIVLSSSP